MNSEQPQVIVYTTHLKKNTFGGSVISVSTKMDLSSIYVIMIESRQSPFTINDRLGECLRNLSLPPSLIHFCRGWCPAHTWSTHCNMYKFPREKNSIQQVWDNGSKKKRKLQSVREPEVSEERMKERKFPKVYLSIFVENRRTNAAIHSILILFWFFLNMNIECWILNVRDFGWVPEHYSTKF